MERLVEFPKARKERFEFEHAVIMHAMPSLLLSFNEADSGEVYVRYVSETLTRVEFILVLRVSADFPGNKEKGRVYIYSPRPLKSHGGSDISGASHENHTLGLSKDGLVCVCDGERFREENTFANLFQKAFVWVEAYLYHRRTGKSIADALPSC